MILKMICHHLSFMFQHLLYNSFLFYIIEIIFILAASFEGMSCSLILDSKW